MHSIRMNILGGFDFMIDGKSVSALNGHAAKLRSILAYLILHRDRAVSHTELIETFYADENQSNPAGALKMQIMRIRNAITPLLDEGEAPIVSRRGSYQWNPDLKCTVDSEDFEWLCHSAEQVMLPTDERLLLYKQVLSLYAGEVDLENSLFWASTLNAKYHRKYISAAENYAALLGECNEHTQMEEVCLTAIEHDPTNEALHILLIRSLLAQKKHPEARKYYHSAVNLLYQELGVRPSQELSDLYAQCESDENPLELDLSSVMVTMRDNELNRHAYFCGFEQFKSIYQLEVRRALRFGGCLHIAMLTVSDDAGKQLPTKVNNAMMDQVQETIVSNLRQSDVVAQYSSCQFVIMLPYANLEDSHMVLDRIIKAYHRGHPKNLIGLSYQIRELELI